MRGVIDKLTGNGGNVTEIDDFQAPVEIELEADGWICLRLGQYMTANIEDRLIEKTGRIQSDAASDIDEERLGGFADVNGLRHRCGQIPRGVVPRSRSHIQ